MRLGPHFPNTGGNSSNWLNMISFLREYWHPAAVLLGILLGLGADLLGFAPIANWVWGTTLILGGFPVVWKTVKGIFRGQFAADIVATLAIVTAAGMEQFLAGSVVVLMQSGGEALEEYGLKRAKSSLDQLLSRAPSIARRRTAQGLEEIPVTDVQIGDLLVVRPGDLIPVDGTITEGTCDIDESALTGEPLPRPRAPDDHVLSGSIATNGAFTMRAQKVAGDSQYAQIVKLMKRAQEEKAPIERMADRAAIYFTPLTIVMAALGYWWTREPVTILAVLVVATPCPLILAVPIAIMAGVNRAARAGIIVKGGASMEEIGHTQAMIFDKTGTITVGEPFLEGMLSLDGSSKADILRKAAALEQLSNHIVARAVVTAANEQSQSLPQVTQFREVPGRGVQGTVEGEELFLGSLSHLQGQVSPQVIDILQKRLAHGDVEGKLTACLTTKDRAVGILVLGDRMRAGVPTLIDHLREMGVRSITMLTGDNEHNAEIIAQQAGIPHVYANLLPQQKVEAVRHIAQHFPYCVMVGDGINDAPALAAARVGVAMGAHGTAVSAEAADIVLLVDDISKVGEIVRIGQRTLRIARESVGIGIGLSFLLMCVAAAGYIPPIVGALSQEVIDVVVILNALRGMTAGRAR